ncbi:MAG: LapA family protein [Nitrospirota bacterium]
MITLIFLLLITAAVAVFSVQNAVPVTISLFIWRFDASLAIVIFLSVLSGIVIGTAAVYLMRAKRYLKNKESDTPQENINK